MGIRPRSVVATALAQANASRPLRLRFDQNHFDWAKVLKSQGNLPATVR